MTLAWREAGLVRVLPSALKHATVQLALARLLHLGQLTEPLDLGPDLARSRLEASCAHQIGPCRLDVDRWDGHDLAEGTR